MGRIPLFCSNYMPFNDFAVGLAPPELPVGFLPQPHDGNRPHFMAHCGAVYLPTPIHQRKRLARHPGSGADYLPQGPTAQAACAAGTAFFGASRRRRPASGYAPSGWWPAAVAQMGPRVEAARRATAQHAVEGGGPLPGSHIAGKQVVPLSRRARSDGVLHTVVINFDIPVLQIDQQAAHCPSAGAASRRFAENISLKVKFFSNAGLGIANNDYGTTCLICLSGRYPASPRRAATRGPARRGHFSAAPGICPEFDKISGCHPAAGAPQWRP